MTPFPLDRLLQKRYGPAALLSLGIVYHYLCHAAMLLLVLWNELRPAPHLTDVILSIIPYVAVIARYNYYLWILAYMPLALYLFLKDKKGFARFMLLGGIISLLRGLMIPLTGLGPCQGPDINAHLVIPFLKTWWTLVNPYTALVQNVAGVALTKDLFFSGHVATTFLLYLYGRHLPRGRAIFLLANLATTAIVFLSHLHYTIDVIAAYAITYALYHSIDARLQKIIN